LANEGIPPGDVVSNAHHKIGARVNKPAYGIQRSTYAPTDIGGDLAIVGVFLGAHVPATGSRDQQSD
jgi:hypothetical protein